MKAGAVLFQQLFRRSSKQELQFTIDQARTVVPQGIYRHKNSGDWYRVHSIALEEKKLTPIVCYTPYQNENIMWTRPVNEFVKRFEQIKYFT